MNNQFEFDSFAVTGGDRLLLGQTDPFVTLLPWEKDRLGLDVTRLATPLAPILTNDVTGTLADNFLANGSYTPSALIGQSLLLGPQLSSFELLGSSSLVAASGTDAVGQTLDQLILTNVKAAAIAEWIAVGITEADRSLLETVQITVTDLPSQILGQANGYQIVIDNDAAGVGWDVDLTPLVSGNTGKQRVDLLTLVTHEFGHVLGFGHSAQGIMAETLPIGVRVAPTITDLQEPRVDTSAIRNPENGNIGADIDLFVVDPPTSVPPILTIGQSLDVNWIVKNGGSVEINNGFEYGIYLSDDPIFDPALPVYGLTLNALFDHSGSKVDQYISRSYVSKLSLGQDLALTSAIKIPKNATPGNNYLIFVADINEGISETNERNNVTAIPIEILAPDLAIKDVAVLSNVNIGSKVDVNWSLINNGIVDSPTGDLYNRIILSKDDTLGNGDDRDLGTYLNSLPVITANGGIFTSKNSVFIPNDIIGLYNIFLIADSNYGQSDTDRTNNVSNPIPINILGLDLAVKNFRVSGDIVSGHTVEINWSLTNVGKFDSPPASLYNKLTLSKDNILGNDDDRVIDNYYYSPPALTANNGVFASKNNVFIPRYIQGDYNLFLTVDAGGYLGDTNRLNNVSTLVPVTVTAPTLTIQSFTASASAVSGYGFDINWSLVNQSNTNYTPGVLASRVILSKDSILGNDDDRTLSDINGSTPALAAKGGTYSSRNTVPVPTGVIGEYNVFLIADVYNYVSGIDSLNNISAPVPITIGAPNLHIESFNVPNTITQGSNFDIQWTVKNIGSVYTANGYWTDKVYLSRDNVLDNNDQEIDSVPYREYYYQSLQPNGSYSKIRNLKFTNLENGTYHLIVATNVGQQMFEVDATDNILVTAPISIVTEDLQAVSLDITDSSSSNSSNFVAFERPFNLNWKVNTGAVGLINSSWKDTFYLSTDDKISSDDRVVFAQKQTRILASGVGYQNTASISINPNNSLPINYGYLTEDNLPGSLVHDTFATAINIQQNLTSDPAGYSIKLYGEVSNFDRLEYYSFSASPGDTIVLDSLTDGAVATLYDQNGMTLAEDGRYSYGYTDVNSKVTYKLNDSAYAGQYYIGISKFRYGNYNYLNYGFQLGLQTAQITNVNTIVPGEYYLLLKTNEGNDFPETNTGNNTAVSAAKITLVDGSKPDLTIQGSSVSEIQVGQYLPISWTVTNSSPINPADSGWIDNVYLSDDAVLDIADTIISSIPRDVSQPLLSPRESYVVTQYVKPPANALGSKYLIFVTDSKNERIEANESNNLSVLSLSIVRPDLQVTKLSNIPNNLESGQDITVKWSTLNSGSGATPASWQEHVYLSDSPDKLTNELLLKVVANTEVLGANASIDRQITAKIPLAIKGQKYIIVTVDAYGAIGNDGDRTNNTVNQGLLIQLAPYADLVVSNVQAPTLIVADPAEITVSWQVTNQGTGAGISPNWVDQVWLIGEGQELKIGEYQHVGGLGATEFYQRTENILLPAAFTGEYQVVVRTDTAQQVFEDFHDDNNSSKAVNLLSIAPIPFADLAISDLKLAESIDNINRSGQNVSIGWKVTNQGIGITNQERISEIVFLTSDAAGKNVIASNAFDYLGQVQVNGSYQRSADFKLPDGLNGNFYLFTTINPTNSVFELNKRSNNTQNIPIAIQLTPSPDLVVTNVAAPEIVQAGDRIDISWQVKNQGTGEATKTWQDQVYLQEIGKPDSVVDLGTFTYNRILGVDQSYIRSESFNIPNNLQGQFQVLVKTNSAKSLYESDTANNANSSLSPIQISYPLRPDLQIESITVPNEVNAGGTVTAEIVIRNTGTSVAQGIWQDSVYLSLDGNVDGSDILLGTFNNVTALSPTQSYSIQTSTVNVPQSYRGTVNVLVQTNVGKQIIESSTENNASSKSIQIREIKPADLVTSNVIVPDQAFAGSSVTVRYRVTNLGANETNRNEWTDSIWLSASKGIPNSLVSGGNGFHLADISRKGVLGLGESYEETVQVTLPNGINGEYYLTPWSDTYDVVLEDTYDINKNPDDPNQVDGNNYKAAKIKVLAIPLPLVLLPDYVTNNVVSSATKVPGSTDILNVSWKVTNEGVIGKKSGSFVDNIYLSDTQTLNPLSQAFLVGSVSRDGGLGVGESYTASFSRQLDPSISSKYVIVTTSPIYAREDISGQVTQDVYLDDFGQLVFGSNLFQPEKRVDNNIAVGTVDISSPAPADLVVSAVTTVNTSFSNEEVEVSWKVTNQGKDTWDGTKYWYDIVWFSIDPELSGSPPLRYEDSTYREKLVGIVPHDNSRALKSGESYRDSLKYVLPAGIDGSKYYFHVATNYFEVGSDGLGRLAPNWSVNSYPSFTSTAFENTTNNLGKTRLSVVYREPDLQVTNLPLIQELTAGTQTTATWEVSNLGGRDTRENSWRDAVFLSKDTSLDGTDTLLTKRLVGASYAGTIHSGALKTDEKYQVNSLLDLPIDIAAGKYYLLYATDIPTAPQFGNERFLGTVPEFRTEGNNIRFQEIRVILPELPDLQVSNIQVPQRGISGQLLNLKYRVSNLGVSDTQVPIPYVKPGQPPKALWQDHVYLSRDKFLDTTIDRFIGAIDRVENLGKNNSYDVDALLSLPKDLTGPYYLFVLSDGGNSVYEGNKELNNALAINNSILIDLPPAADLQVDEINPPIQGQSGGIATISWKVSNHSTQPVQGGLGFSNGAVVPLDATWSDSVYLSSDNKWDIKDKYLGQVSHTGSLQSNDSYTASLQANLPALTPGKYYVIVRTDAQDQVYEGDNEANNQIVSVSPLTLSAFDLYLNQPVITKLNSGQERLYRVTVADGQTLKVSLGSKNTEATNEIFVRYAQAPTAIEYDASYTGIITSSPTTVIAGTRAGDYYVLVKGAGDISLKAELLPFGISDVVTDRGGDSKYVTSRIIGAQFQPGAIVKLIRPGIEEVLPVRTQTIDSTNITAIFDFTNVTHGLYDIKVINPDGQEAILPYRYLVEKAIAPDVTVGINGKRVLALDEAYNFGISVKSNSNLDTPYVQFQYGAPELEVNPVLDVKYLEFSNNLRGNPSNSLTDLPWAKLSSELNSEGNILAAGYIYDLPTGGYIGQNLPLHVYPRIFEQYSPETLSRDYLAFSDFIAFKFYVVASATALTRDEFITQQQKEALRLRAGILADVKATPALKLLATDANSWIKSYFGALEEAGIIRPVDSAPPIRTQPVVASMLATLSTGILLGTSGQTLVSNGDLVDFFNNVRRWYGQDKESMLAPYDFKYVPVRLEVPDFKDFDLKQTSPTHVEGVNVYVPFGYTPLDQVIRYAQENSFSSFFQSSGKIGTSAVLTGPVGSGAQNFVGVETPETYTLQLRQEVSKASAQVRVLTQLDTDLDPLTFKLGDIQLGDIKIHIPDGRFKFDGDFDFTQTKGFVLHVSAGIDGATNTATWLLQAIDPNTGNLVEGAFAGLLGTSNLGQLSYQIQPKQSLATGTVINSQMRVFFDNAAPVDTAIISSTIDGAAPTSKVTATPIVVGSNDYVVKWTAKDDDLGSGVASTSIYVSDNGGDSTVWLSQSKASEGMFHGQQGHKYEFISIATDAAGNAENQQFKLRDVTTRLVDSQEQVTGTDSGTVINKDLPTNNLFGQIEKLVPGRTSVNPAAFQQTVRPFVASSLVKDLPVSEGGVGALAVLALDDGTGRVLVSGGANRGSLYLVDKLGNKQLLADVGEPIFDLVKDANGALWATTGGAMLLLSSITLFVTASHGICQ